MQYRLKTFLTVLVLVLLTAAGADAAQGGKKGNKGGKNDDNGGSNAGQMINVRGVSYEVVGVFDDVGGEGELRTIYVPISTAQLVYHGGNDLHQLMFTTGAASVAESEALVRASRQLLATRLHFDHADRRAVHGRIVT